MTRKALEAAAWNFRHVEWTATAEIAGPEEPRGQVSITYGWTIQATTSERCTHVHMRCGIMGPS